MDWYWFMPPAALLILAVLLIRAWKPLARFGQEVHVERARELFRLQRERLEAEFFQAAAASGKPRGLRWKECAFEAALELARDRASKQLVALTPVTISFEAIEGGDMEGVAAVGNLRNASAVFFFERGQWRTAGRALFNLNPDEALDHLKNQYERIDAAPAG